MKIQDSKYLVVANLVEVNQFYLTALDSVVKFHTLGDAHAFRELNRMTKDFLSEDNPEPCSCAP